MRLVPTLFLGLFLAGCGSDGAPPEDATAADTSTGDVAEDTEPNDVNEVGEDAIGVTEDTDGPDADTSSDTDATDVELDPAEDPVDVPDDVSTDLDAIDSPDADTDASSDPDVEPDPDVAVDPDVAEPDVPRAWFELGIGEEEFAPVVAEQDAFMAQGIQGGFHIWGAFQAAGFEPEGYSLEVTLRDSDGELVGAVFYDRALETNAAGDFEAVGVTVFIGPEVIPELEDGSVWEYCATLTSTDGFIAEQCSSITARCCEYLDF